MEKKINFTLINSENREEDTGEIHTNYELSLHEELCSINGSKHVTLVKHIETGELRIKKSLKIYDKNVYDALKKNNFIGIPRIHFCEETSENKLIVIEEYIHGKTLEQIFDEKGVFSENVALKYAIIVCNILITLHSQVPKIIHRDLKLSNIIVSNDNIVKLLDFNSSKVYKAEQQKDTVLMGTKNFAAPEQYGFMQSDERSDVYGIGVVLHYMLTGGFPGEKFYNGRLELIIKKATEMNPKDRYQNVYELKKELEVIFYGRIPSGNCYENIGKSSSSWQRQNIANNKNFHKNNQTVDNNRYKEKYRELKIIRKIIGLFFYILFMISGFFFSPTRSDGSEMPLSILWLNRAFYMIIVTGVYAYLSNFCGMKKVMLGKNKNILISLILQVLHVVIFFFVTICILIIIEATYYAI